MSDPPDLEKNDPEKHDLEGLARRYLDLWQDQLAGLAADPEVAETIARTLQLMNAGAAQVAAQMADMAGPPSAPGRHKSGEELQDHDATSDNQSAGNGVPTPGPQAAAPSHGASDRHVAELLRRIGALEERIAVLEAGPDGGGGGPEKRSKGRRA